jgi:hypothetical protein
VFATFQGAGAGGSMGTADTIWNSRTAICVAGIVFLCSLVYAALWSLERRQRAIRDAVVLTVLQKETFARIDRYLTQTLINSEARRQPTLSTPVVDEVLDETLASVLRGESLLGQTHMTNSAARKHMAQNAPVADPEPKTLAPSPEESVPNRPADTPWWKNDEENVIAKLRRLKPGTLPPPGLEISTIFMLVATTVGVLVFALILLPGTWSDSGTWLDEILTMIAVVGGGSVATALVAVRRRLGLLVERGSQSPEAGRDPDAESAPLEASPPAGTRRGGPGIGRHYPSAEPSREEMPVNRAETLLRFLISRAALPEPEWHKQIDLGRPFNSTTPDCFWPLEDEPGLCLYMDGLSGHIHGSPATREKDRAIREMLRSKHYEVVEIAATQLHDRGAMMQHFVRIARILIGKERAKVLRDDESWFAMPETA